MPGILSCHAAIVFSRLSRCGRGTQDVRQPAPVERFQCGCDRQTHSHSHTIPCTACFPCSVYDSLLSTESEDTSLFPNFLLRLMNIIRIFTCGLLWKSCGNCGKQACWFSTCCAFSVDKRFKVTAVSHMFPWI